MVTSIIDIAKHCNLSVSTVSRALNNQYGVSEKAKKKVLQAAEELGYVPNLGAKELVSKKSNLIGLILHGDHYNVRPAFLEHLPSINHTLNLFGKDTIIQTISRNSYKEGDLQQVIKKRNFEGCIIFPGFLMGHPIFDDVKKIKTPIVVLEEDLITKNCSHINTDEVLGGHLATEHLIRSGHEKIGFINGPLFALVSQLRLEGYLKALENHNIPVRDEYIIESDYSGEGGASSVLRLLEKNPEITAVFFANDVMAMGAISKLAEKNIKVPMDLSVVGYNGDYLTPYYNPPLTTVQIPYQRIGIRAAELLIELIHGGYGKGEAIKPELMERKSVFSIN